MSIPFRSRLGQFSGAGDAFLLNKVVFVTTPATEDENLAFHQLNLVITSFGLLEIA